MALSQLEHILGLDAQGLAKKTAANASSRIEDILSFQDVLAREKLQLKGPVSSEEVKPRTEVSSKRPPTSRAKEQEQEKTSHKAMATDRSRETSVDEGTGRRIGDADDHAPVTKAVSQEEKRGATAQEENVSSNATLEENREETAFSQYVAEEAKSVTSSQDFLRESIEEGDLGAVQEERAEVPSSFISVEQEEGGSKPLLQERSIQNEVQLEKLQQEAAGKAARLDQEQALEKIESKELLNQLKGVEGFEELKGSSLALAVAKVETELKSAPSGQLLSTDNFLSLLAEGEQVELGETTQTFSEALREKEILTESFTGNQENMNGSRQENAADPLFATNTRGVQGLDKAEGPEGTFRQQLARPASMIEQIKINISRAVQEGENNIRVQLRPATLGSVDVKLEVVGGKISATVMVEKAETLEMLKQDADSLLKALKEQGLESNSSDLNFMLKKDQDGSHHLEKGSYHHRLGEREQELEEAAMIPSSFEGISAAGINIRV